MLITMLDTIVFWLKKNWGLILAVIVPLISGDIVLRRVFGKPKIVIKCIKSDAISPLRDIVLISVYNEKPRWYHIWGRSELDCWVEVRIENDDGIVTYNNGAAFIEIGQDNDNRFITLKPNSIPVEKEIIGKLDGETRFYFKNPIPENLIEICGTSLNACVKTGQDEIVTQAKWTIDNDLNIERLE
jgi:hypothetical protein